jgi:MtN3 and saliva related transmembrane protein
MEDHVLGAWGADNDTINAGIKYCSIVVTPFVKMNSIAPSIINTVGFVAGTFTTLSFLPQVVSVLRSGDYSSVNINTFLIHGTGVGLWLAYGFLNADPVVVLFNGVTLVLCLVVICSYSYQKAFPPEALKMTTTGEEVV